MSGKVIYETTRVIERPLETVKQEILSLTQQAQISAVHYACEIGKRLIEAKEQVGHGNWGEWLKTEVNYSQSNAENFMKIYREYGDNQLSLFSDFSNSQTIGNLSISKLLLLTSVPAEEREEFANEVDAENISVRELQEKLKEKDGIIETEKSRADAAAESIKKLEEDIKTRDEKMADLEARIADYSTQIEDAPSGDMGDAQKAELEKVKNDYEDKLEKLKEKNKKDLEKKAKAEEDLKNDLVKAKAEKEAAERKCDEMQKAANKANLSSNGDLVLMNEYLKRLQREADNVTNALEGFKGNEMYEKIRSGVIAILKDLTEKVG